LLYSFIPEAIAYRGDVIGCTVKFDDKTAVDGKVQIVFTLNGKQITQDEIFMDYDPFKNMYPFICMGHTGMKVLAKVSIYFPKRRMVNVNVKLVWTDTMAPPT